MAYPSIESWIRQQTGLEANLIGVNRLVRVVRQRMDFYQLDSVDLYLNRLKFSSQELDVLLEQIVIPETWFFRSRARRSLGNARHRRTLDRRADG